MLLGRSVKLWNALVVALAAAIVATLSAAGYAVSVEMVAADIAAAAAIIGLLSNEADPMAASVFRRK